ncbi:hypothetical protein ACFPRL_25655 [Pseudoclavibacter helvolus]
MDNASATIVQTVGHSASAPETPSIATTRIAIPASWPMTRNTVASTSGQRSGAVWRSSHATSCGLVASSGADIAFGSASAAFIGAPPFRQPELQLQLADLRREVASHLAVRGRCPSPRLQGG